MWAQQEPPAPSNTPDEGAPPNGKPGRGGNAEIRRNTNQRIAEFLTPEQKKQWQDMRQERHGSGGPAGGQAGPGGQGSTNAPATPQNPPKPN
jgi:hypothetical protein